MVVERVEKFDPVQWGRRIAEGFPGGHQPYQTQPEARARCAGDHQTAVGTGQRSGREIYPDGTGRPPDILN
ncbi:hypothetical protein D3C87_2053040 [compost metagenome]